MSVHFMYHQMIIFASFWLYEDPYFVLWNRWMAELDRWVTVLDRWLYLLVAGLWPSYPPKKLSKLLAQETVQVTRQKCPSYQPNSRNCPNYPPEKLSKLPATHPRNCQSYLFKKPTQEKVTCACTTLFQSGGQPGLEDLF